jgi:hypothetical protein
MTDRAQRPLELLVRLDGLRLAALARRPTVGLALAVGIPLLVVLAGLWILGRFAPPSLESAGDGVAVGMLVAAPVAFLAYGVLFGGADDGFLRRAGVPPGVLFLERGFRLAACALSIALLLTVPHLSAGGPLPRVLATTFAAAAAAAGVSLLSLGWAARATVDGPGWIAAGIRQFDPALARAAPLVYAPVLPFVAGALVGGAVAGSAGGAPVLAGGALVVSAGLLLLGTRVYGPAGPRFYPRVREMGYAPPAEGAVTTFRAGRGLARLLPRHAAAVWVRDATVAGRRFRWAARVTWPVGILAVVLLARWGTVPAVRGWVVAAVGLTLLVQVAAIVGLGAAERAGPAWLDRAAGVRPWERLLGRAAWGWGLSLWLLVPTALAWNWWSGAGGALYWPVAGLLTASVGSIASVLYAQRR